MKLSFRAANTNACCYCYYYSRSSSTTLLLSTHIYSCNHRKYWLGSNLGYLHRPDRDKFTLIIISSLCCSNSHVLFVWQPPKVNTLEKVHPAYLTFPIVNIWVTYKLQTVLRPSTLRLSLNFPYIFIIICLLKVDFWHIFQHVLCFTVVHDIRQL